MPTPIHEYKDRIARILGSEWDGDHIQLALSVDTVDGAKKELKNYRQYQKELRLVKRLLNQDIKDVKQVYRAKIADAPSGRQSVKIFGIRFGGSGPTAKQRLSQEMKSAIEPWERMKLSVDDLLTQMDRTKLQIEDYISRNSD